MEIRTYISPMLSSNMYVVIEEQHCVIIDPYYDEKSARFLDGLQPDFMLVTHEHYDHISGVNALKDHYGIPLYANAACGKNLRNPAKNYAKFYDAYVNFQKGERVEKVAVEADYACCADELLEDGQTLSWRGHTILIKMAPGHSAGSNLILLDRETMFSGDCMLAESVPAARFPGGNHRAFLEITLPYLKSLDGNTIVFPGHYGCFRLRDYYQLK